jgi:thiamine pyrophosphate-dependent acetolactate synthase large subunit-like protein
MKLSDYVAAFLVQHTEDVFLLPGGACMHLTDSVGKQPGLNYVCCLHEQGCAFAAEAYAEYGKQLGVCLVTGGPGGTNALTGTACAWIESAPVLFVSGQAKRPDLIESRRMPVRSMGPQEVDIIAMVKPITKYAVRIMDPATIRLHLERAVWTAKNGRPGPVWLDIPLDVQAAQIEPDQLTGFVPPAAVKRPLDTELSRVLETLSHAERPVLYVGNGVRTGGVAPQLRELIDLLQVPVLTTWKAADLIPEDHPCYIGRPGSIGQRGANFTQQKADWLLVLGARLDLPSLAFNHAGFAPKAHKILVDIDEAELAKFDPAPQQLIHADLADFLPALLERVKDLEARSWKLGAIAREPGAGSEEPRYGVESSGAGYQEPRDGMEQGGARSQEPGRQAKKLKSGSSKLGGVSATGSDLAPSSKLQAPRASAPWRDWLTLCRSWVAKYPVVQAHHRETQGFISTYALMDVLSDLAQPDDVMVPGSSGPCSDIFYQAFRVKEGQRIMNAPGLGAMGTGLPGTIGACLASGGRRVINVNGDGGFQLNIQELETVRRLNLPIKYIVLDNDGYRSIVGMQRNHFQGRLVGSDPSSQLTLPETTRVAQAYGIPANRVEVLDQLSSLLTLTLNAPGPRLLVVKTSKDEKTEPRVSSEMRPDGTIVSRPMDQMWPMIHQPNPMWSEPSEQSSSIGQLNSQIRRGA